MNKLRALSPSVTLSFMLLSSAKAWREIWNAR